MFGRAFFGPHGHHAHHPFGRGRGCAPLWGLMGHGMDWHHRREHGPAHFGRWSEQGGLSPLVLDVLREAPASGLELLQRLEERLKGVFDASPETLYPVLQLLEDQGYVTGERQGDRKVFSVTDAGRSFLTEQADTLAASWERASAGRYHAELHDLMGSFKSLARLFVGRAAQGRLDPQRVARIRTIIERAKKDIQDDLAS